MSALDALKLNVETAIRVILEHPSLRNPIRDEDGIEAYIDVLPTDSAKAKQLALAATNKRLNRRGGSRLTAEEIAAEQIETLAELTTGWHLVGLDGKKIDFPFSKSNAILLYTNTAFAWIREQVESDASNRANFTPAGSKS
jgi:hypothetical protein